MKILLLTVEVPETPAGVKEIVDEIENSPLMTNLVRFNLGDIQNLKDLNNLVSDFGIIIIHNTATYDWKYLEYILRVIEGNSKAKIIILKQDEHVAPQKFDSLFCEYNVFAVFTCLSDEYIHIVYPFSFSRKIEFRKMYTAYLTSRLLNLKSTNAQTIKRVSYRGSLQPVWLGKLGQDKAMIPDWTIKESGNLNNWIIDVSSKWEDRLYGSAWDDLVSRSSILLGSESGSNVFNLDGQLLEKTQSFSKTYGEPTFQNEELYDKYYNQVLLPYEGKIDYGTIAPRHLEAAMQGKPMILTEGKYEGLFEHGISAVQLAPGFKGLEGTILQFEDSSFAGLISTNAKETVLARSDLRISSLIQSISDVVTEIKLNVLDNDSSHTISSIPTQIGSKKSEFAILTPVTFERDPRHTWWLHSLQNKNADIQILEFNPALNAAKPQIEFRKYIAEMQSTDIATLGGNFSTSLEIIANHMLDIDDPTLRYFLMRLNRFALEKQFSVSKFLARLFVRQAATLIQISKYSLPANFVACDLQSAFAAVVAFGNSNSSIIYDAQESFPDQYMVGPEKLPDEEFEFWVALDNFIMQKSSSVVCMTGGLSELAHFRSGIQSFILPNFVPLGNVERNESFNSGPIRFVFMGNAAPKRGLELLIENWIENSDIAELHFFMPDSEYVQKLIQLAQQKLLLYPDIKMIFHSAVDEADMIKTLAEFDVGVIPYDYTYPYNHCSPNKFGQYLAAGLAVLSNDLHFIAEIIYSRKCGLVFNWRDERSFKSSVKALLDRNFLNERKGNSTKAFQVSDNWDTYFEKFFDHLDTAKIINFLASDDVKSLTLKNQVRLKSGKIEFSAYRLSSNHRFHFDPFPSILRWIGRHHKTRNLFKRFLRIPIIGSVLVRIKLFILAKYI